MPNLFHRLRTSQSGATIIEFAFVAPVMCMFILGMLEIGHLAYVRSKATGAIEQVARSSGVGGATVDYRAAEVAFETAVRRVAVAPTFTWTRKSYYEFSGIGKPEKLTDDKDGDGRYDVGDCWQDINPNRAYDVSPGRDGVGGADDIVFYEVKIDYPPLIPVAALIPGVPNQRSTTVRTIVKRQPFAAQSVPAIRC